MSCCACAFGGVEVAFGLAYNRRGEGEILPQRLHKVCVLLWRLPKDEVPFAVGIDQFAVLGVHIRRALTYSL